MIDWERYAPYFKREEFQCKHCGALDMQQEFLDRLFTLRKAWARPMVFSSAYRCPAHPIEAAKPNGAGPHSTGRAVDIVCRGADALELVQKAMECGFTGFGVNQKGPAGRFIHLDDLQEQRPNLWTY